MWRLLWFQGVQAGIQARHVSFWQEGEHSSCPSRGSFKVWSPADRIFLSKEFSKWHIWGFFVVIFVLVPLNSLCQQQCHPWGLGRATLSQAAFGWECWWCCLVLWEGVKALWGHQGRGAGLQSDCRRRSSHFVLDMPDQSSVEKLHWAFESSSLQHLRQEESCSIFAKPGSAGWDPAVDQLLLELRETSLEWSLPSLCSSELHPLSWGLGFAGGVPGCGISQGFNTFPNTGQQNQHSHPKAACEGWDSWFWESSQTRGVTLLLTAKLLLTLGQWVGTKQILQQNPSAPVFWLSQSCSCPWHFAFSRAGSCPWGRLDFPLSHCRVLPPKQQGTSPALPLFPTLTLFLWGAAVLCSAEIWFDELHLLFDRNNEEKCFESEVLMLIFRSPGCSGGSFSFCPAQGLPAFPGLVTIKMELFGILLLSLAVEFKVFK